jgi:putative DNA primase/helicase
MTKPTPARSRPQRTITPELIRAALACIPPDVDRESWARTAMAIKSELASAAGFELWSEWSARGESFDPRSARDTWRSIKAGGGVGIGTLFGMAKDHGFRFPEGEAVQTPALGEAERLAELRRKEREAEAADYRRRAERAARDAVHLWTEASEAGQSPYLQRKGVQGQGVRYLADGTLLVPMRDAAGELHNLQRIAPALPADGAPEKRFLPGGRKSGLFHLIGQAEGAAVLLLAEGYATAATVHEATGRPAVVGFDAGNLVHVAKALRERWPAAALLVCADDDRDTEARTGKNPGRDKAEAAARAARTGQGLAAVALPDGVAAGGSDFNDLAAHAGLPAVAALVEAAAAELVAPTMPLAAAPQPAKSDPGAAIRAANDAQAQPEAGNAPSGPDALQQPEPPDAAAAGIGQAGPTDTAPALPDPFAVDDRGVWHVARDAEGNEKRPVWLCARLVVTARTRTDDANGWGCLLEFADPDGNAKTWAMPSALLSGEGAEWAGRLRDMGLRMAPGTRARNLIAQYIDTRNPPERVICTDRVGWHGPVYVLPSGSIVAPTVAATGRRYVFQSDSGMEDTFRRHGDLATWQRTVAAPAAGNSRIVFALCCAFAGPMLRLAGMESGGFHLRGGSSQGKTTALKVAASVWGRPSYMQRWRTTDNALEATAVQHCDGLLILDEFGQLDARVAGECAYMLANDQEKGRATRAGLARKRRTWRLLFLSSGEVSLADHMAEAGKRTRAGMEVRMLDVPLDSGAGMGGVEVLHGHEGPGELADAIVSAAASQYGTAGRAWLEWACERHAELPQRLQELIERHRADLVPESASEQVRRAGSRFALVATAGELATQAGITGWAEGEALQAARRCFKAWLEARGHLDNGEDAAMLRQVRCFLELNGEGRFAWWHRAMDDHTPKTLNRAGFRRLLGQDGKPVRSDAEHQREYGERMSTADGEQAQVEFIVLREVFRGEMCKGFDPEAVAKLLQRRGHLAHEPDRLTIKHRLPGIGKAPCFQIKPSVFCDEL